jgi:hypothetical protein
MISVRGVCPALLMRVYSFLESKEPPDRLYYFFLCSYRVLSLQIDLLKKTSMCGGFGLREEKEETRREQRSG